MKNLLKWCLVGFMFWANQSQACTYTVNELAIRNDLVSHLLSTLNIGIDEILTRVTKLEVSDFSFHESKPSRMCPVEMTYFATVELEYQDNALCHTTAQVTLVEGWGTDTYRYFKVDYPADGPVCLDL